MSSLPKELLRDLSDAVVSLNCEQISAVIARVAEEDERLAAVLTHMKDRLAYTAILNAIEEGES